MNAATEKTQVTITRVIDTHRHYPRSGNFDTQKPSYRWVVCAGSIIENAPTLRKAKLIASDYTKGKVIVIR